MRTNPPDKWTAFMLSLAVPGAGQLFAGRWSCLAWFLAGAAAGILPGLLPSLGPALYVSVTLLTLAAVGLCSAEHAKRCLEPRQTRRRVVTSRVSCGRMHEGAVDLSIEIAVPRPHAEVWPIVADLPRFGCIDPFHRRVILLNPPLKHGAALALEHGAFGVTFWRFGRLLKWREGECYAFSDLSARGCRHGFPHVFFVRVTADGPGKTRLEVRVRGKWTARLTPGWLARCWLRYVCLEHARLLRRAFEEAP